MALQIDAAVFFVVVPSKFVDLPIAEFAWYHRFSAEVLMIFEFFKGHDILADAALNQVRCQLFLVGYDNGF